MVPPAERSKLIALFYASVNTGLMLGPALAAVMLLFASPREVLIVDALTFVVSALLLAGVDLGPRTEERTAERPRHEIAVGPDLGRRPGRGPDSRCRGGDGGGHAGGFDRRDVQRPRPGLLTVAMAMFGALSFRAARSREPALAPTE